MFRTKTKKVAESLAKEHGKSYGLSAIDGKWYVGELPELERCGVPSVDTIRA